MGWGVRLFEETQVPLQINENFSFIIIFIEKH